MNRDGTLPGSSILGETDVHTIALRMRQDFDLCERHIELYSALELRLADSINIPEDRYRFFTFMLAKWIAKSCSECPSTVDRLVVALRSLQMNSFADSILALERDGEIGATPNLRNVTPQSRFSGLNDVNINTGICLDLVEPLVAVAGRNATLNDLHTLVTRNAGNEKKIPITSQLTCVWGLGGVGKTTLVRKYAWDNCDHFDGNVIWIKADDEQQIQDSFEKFASSDEVNIQLQDWNNPEANMLKIFKFFSNRKSLFVFDNVEKYAGEVDKFLPLNLGPNINKPYFLMTSRKEGLNTKIRDFKLDVPSLDDMTKLMAAVLKLQTEEDKSIAHCIVVQLQGLPLAVQQAISYIQNLEKNEAEKINPIQEYLNLLLDKSEIQTILNFATADNYGKTVLRTWTTTMKTISQYDTYGPFAERIMNVLAYFNHDSIDSEILELVYSKQIVEKSLKLLAEYSMIERKEMSISIHRLVQHVIRIWNEFIDKDLLKDCLEIMTKLPHTLMENSHTIWNSALNYNDLVRKYPSVGIRLCENVHFGGKDPTNIFQYTCHKFNEVFGMYGVPTIELNCIRIISLCHDMCEPVYSLILQLNDELIGRLRISNLVNIYEMLPTLYRLAGSLLKIGKSPQCPTKKRNEIITHSLKHYQRIQEFDTIKPCQV